MAVPIDVEVPPLSVQRLGRVIGPHRLETLLHATRAVQDQLDGAVVWNINSTAHGGGVAEMLRVLCAYDRDAGLDARWTVIDADPEFFAITKRLHNRLHGAPGDGGELGPSEADHYAAVLEKNVDALKGRLHRDDIVFLHDPQTAGMAQHLARMGIRVCWRCHIGTDRANEFTSQAWDFLEPHLDPCESYVFSHAAFVPPFLAGADVWIIEPSIDPLSAKNRPLSRARVSSLLEGIGLLSGRGNVHARAVVGAVAPFAPDDPLVVQVSRWDRLKDMAGVMRGFAEHLAGRDDVRLALVGPAVEAVADDPEGDRVLAQCVDQWASLPSAARNVIRLVCLPMDDPVANALMVNAVQRHARVVVQKSLQEGFGLTVTEAMWKSRPVLASRVGGIPDQVPPGAGVLLDDPADLDAFGRSLAALLAEPQTMATMGRRARRHVRDHSLSDRHLIDYAHLELHMAGH